jgi:holo-[acyl-carrier protein] synthase
MILGTGVDIAEVSRIRESIERFGDRFLRRIFTDGEIRYCERKANRFESYAARFAAKEAGMKALGTGWSHGIRWRDIEVVRPKGSVPPFNFTVRPRPSQPSWARKTLPSRLPTRPSRPWPTSFWKASFSG